MTTIRTLEVLLGDVLVGHLTHYPDEKTIFVVDQGYIDQGIQRPVLSLSLSRPGDEDTTLALLVDDRHKSSLVKAPPFFSNLLPEGGLRKRIAAELKVHEDREFDLLLALGRDLPGAVVLLPAETPKQLRSLRSNFVTTESVIPQEIKFSIGGMQLKFSMLQRGDRFTVPSSGEYGDFIVKPPSPDHEALPNVEMATMAVAREAGIDVPEIMLVSPDHVEGLTMLGTARHGDHYAIRRFDRLPDGRRVHTEDFAQVLNLRVTEKYDHANYEMIAKTLLRYGGGLEDVREMARRLMLNVLMGNGDAHIKNWSLIYDNPQRPRLSKAYDLVATVAYTKNDLSVALNMGGIKRFDTIKLADFDRFLKAIDLSDSHREDIMSSVRKTATTVLDSWAEVFNRHGVPGLIIDKVAQHQMMLPLTAVRWL